MENATVTCPYEGERDTRSLYLAGKLPDTEAQAFEEHFFTCERCAEAVEVGSSLRAAFGKAPVRPAAAPQRGSRTWVSLAAAAVVAFLAVGVWQFARRPTTPAPSVLRSSSSEGALDMRVAAGAPGSLDVAWTSRPEAASYVVQVFKSDGMTVWRSESREPRLSIDRAVLPQDDEPLSIQVEAIDAMGRVVASSELVPIPER